VIQRPGVRPSQRWRVGSYRSPKPAIPGSSPGCPARSSRALSAKRPAQADLRSARSNRLARRRDRQRSEDRPVRGLLTIANRSHGGAPRADRAQSSCRSTALAARAPRSPQQGHDSRPLRPAARVRVVSVALAAAGREGRACGRTARPPDRPAPARAPFERLAGCSERLLDAFLAAMEAPSWSPAAMRRASSPLFTSSEGASRCGDAARGSVSPSARLEKAKRAPLEH